MQCNTLEELKQSIRADAGPPEPTYEDVLDAAAALRKRHQRRRRAVVMPHVTVTMTRVAFVIMQTRQTYFVNSFGLVALKLPLPTNSRWR